MPEFSNNLKMAINRTSQEVAADLESSDAEEVAEVCIDANRLVTFGKSKEADEEVTRLVKEHGYDAVLKEASKHVAVW